MQRRLIVYEFDSYEEFRDALHLLQEKKMNFRAYAPIPEEDLIEHKNKDAHAVTLFAVGGGVVGFIGGFILQLYPNLVSYPINVGGRPLNSWPAFMIICFELTVLCSALAIFSSLFILNRYPRFDRVIFASADFNERRDRNFFLTTLEEVTLDKAIKRFDLALH